jgi:hypothetical protein
VKIALLFALCSLAIGASGAAAGPTAANAIYVVRPDPRACPSPLCGGYWVALANRARTKCSDGLFRPRCYAALAKDESGQPLRTPPDAYGLVRAGLAPQDFGPLGELGVLYVADVWTHAGDDAARGKFFRLRDTGIRCVRSPCFSFRATRLNEPVPAVRISSIDLTSALDITAKLRDRAYAALGMRGGLLAAGRIVVTRDGGRLFRATQVYLKIAPPHA